MTARSVAVVSLSVLVVAAAVALAATWHRPVAEIDPPAAAAFDAAQVAAGARLAALGDCAVCHIGAEGRAYAGGLALPTPFGTIHATNITPDPETGIGRWSLVAFGRALRSGIARDGSHLYPAFPYDHFADLTDDDIAALYAFLMTRPAIRAMAPANHLAFPVNFRPLLAGWNLLFAHRHPFRSDPARPELLNRGAYLVATIGHCGACHSPRNSLGGEERHQALSGGQAEGWDAPALNAASTAPEPWTAAQLFAYLQTGSDERHGAAAGPMAPVIREMARVPEADVQAIAAYVASLMPAGPPPAAVPPRPDEDGSPGAVLFAGACAACHGAGVAPDAAGRVPLALSTDLAAASPTNAIRVVLAGLQPPAAASGPFMPGFAEVLADDQIAALLQHLRQDRAGRPPWPDLAQAVRRARQEAAE
jgi:mono/diheme cytochrome c family protein